MWHELLYGCLRLPPSSQRQRILRFLEDVVRPSLDIIPYDGRVATLHATERARLEGQGRIVPFVDGRIVATAQAHGLILVTRNIRDFEPFAELDVENWFAD